MFIATSYIGSEYTPGEIITEKLPDETIERLLEAGAIRKTAPAQAADEMPQEPPESGLPPEGEQEQAETGEKPEAEPETPETTEEPEDEIDEEAEAPEIDVMAGIVQNEHGGPEPASRPPKNKRKSGGGKAK